LEAFERALEACTDSEFGLDVLPRRSKVAQLDADLGEVAATHAALVSEAQEAGLTLEPLPCVRKEEAEALAIQQRHAAAGEDAEGRPISKPQPIRRIE
jgi:hypothetical protein